jgi:hypothetical protein
MILDINNGTILDINKESNPNTSSQDNFTPTKETKRQKKLTLLLVFLFPTLPSIIYLLYGFHHSRASGDPQK